MLGTGLLITDTFLLPYNATALPSTADVTSPFNLIVIIPSEVAVHVALNVLFVSIASAVASAWFIIHPVTGPNTDVCTFQAAAEKTFTDTVKLSPT